MLAIKIFFTNPMLLITVFFLLENSLLVMLYVFWAKNSQFSIWKLLCCIVLSIVLMVVAYKILFTKDYKKSPVDASPIAELSSEQIGRLEDTLERIKEYEFITRFEIEEEKYTGPHLLKIYSIIWSSKEPRTLLDISVRFYKEEQQAIDTIRPNTGTNNEKKKHNTFIENDNNTDVILGDSWMVRNSDTFYYPDSKRYIASAIRLGNAIISLSETQEYYNLDKNISTEFIKLLCELLQEGE